jgi:uncharacterized membrane protein
MGKDALHSVVEIIQTSLRILAAVFFVVAGTFHFLKPEPYRQIIPPQFPAPQLLVIISGIAEIAGGIGLLIPSFRRWAGWGLVALLIAVFPANFYMAEHPERFQYSRWLLWGRLPLQVVFLVWVWFVAIRRRSRKDL